MADPVLADHWRAQVVFQGKSMLPEDRYVNSFVFRNDGDISTNPLDQRVRAALDNFYFGIAPGQTNALSDYINMAMIASVTVKCYDLGQAPPRNPVEGTIEVNFPPPESLAMPSECAIVLSLRTNLRTPRGRGRIYLGPLNNGVGVEHTNGHLIVKPQAQTDITAAAARLMTGNGQFLTWSVLSQRDAVARPVIGGYVDSAFDTQRRRGEAPSNRVTFGTVL